MRRVPESVTVSVDGTERARPVTRSRSCKRRTNVTNRRKGESRCSSAKKHLSRRTVLRGAGACVALPLLDAMNPAAIAWANTPAGAAPHRMAFVGFPMGAIASKWSPDARPARTSRYRRFSSRSRSIGRISPSSPACATSRLKARSRMASSSAHGFSCVAPADAGVIERRRGCYGGPDGGAAHRPGDAATVPRAHHCAARRADRVAHAEAVVAARGRIRARCSTGCSVKAIRTPSARRSCRKRAACSTASLIRRIACSAASAPRIAPRCPCISSPFARSSGACR